MKPRMLALLSVAGTLLVCLSPAAQPGAQDAPRPDPVLAGPSPGPLADAPWRANVRVNDDSGGADQCFPSIAVDPSGNAYALWTDYRNGNGDLYFSYRPSGGSWSSNVRVNDDLGSAIGGPSSIAVDPSGNAYAVWTDDRNGNWDIYSSLRPAAGYWGGNVKVTDDAGTAHQMWPSIAVDASGNAYAVWEDDRGVSDPDIYFSYRPAGGSWGTNVRVEHHAGNQRKPSIAVDPWGNAYVVWADNIDVTGEIYFSYRPSGGSWGSSIRVTDDTGMTSKFSPSIAVDSNGNAYAVWEDYRDVMTDIYFSYRPAGGSWGTDVMASHDPYNIVQHVDPCIAVDPGGDAYAVWECMGMGSDIYSGYRPAGGSWGPNVRANDDSVAAAQHYPSIAVDLSGNAYVVWQDYRNGDADIYFSYRPAGTNGLFLELPFARSPVGASASQAALSTDTVFVNYYGSVRCFFDHTYPTYETDDDITLSSGRTITHSGCPNCVRRNDCVWGKTCYDGHNGYDFTLPRGESVLAASAGVARYEWDPQCYGNVIRIDHQNGYETFYGHLLADGLITNNPNHRMPVSTGTTIGAVGNTGDCIVPGQAGDGSHLHFAVFRDLDGDGGEPGEVVDPFGWNTAVGPDPWVKDRGGPRSDCLWTFGCYGQDWVTNGGTVTSPGGHISATAPPGAVDDPTILRLTITPDPVADPSAVPTGFSFDLSAQDILGAIVDTFSLPLTIVINYSESILDYVLEETLTLFYWDEASQTWSPIDTSLDLENNTATAQVTHLSPFALRGEPVYAAPTVATVAPSSTYAHLEATITITGHNFFEGPSVRLGNNELKVTYVDSTTLSALVPSGLDPGAYDLTVTNRDGQQGALESCFTVLEPVHTYLPLLAKHY